jgi:hypothetical protein
LTVYKRHKFVIDELEIEVDGTDFSRQTSWWAREDLGKAKTWKSMKNMHVSEMYTNARNNQTCINIRCFWMNLGAS